VTSTLARWSHWSTDGAAALLHLQSSTPVCRYVNSVACWCYQSHHRPCGLYSSLNVRYNTIR